MFPHFHPQQWSHMLVKMCVLCAFSSLICSHAFSPMSPALPGGPSRSLTLFIQSEQLGPSQPKQEGGVQSMGEEMIKNFRFNQALEMPLCSLSFPSFFVFFVLAFVSCSPGCLGPDKVRSCPVQVSCWTNITVSFESCFFFCLNFHQFVFLFSPSLLGF